MHRLRRAKATHPGFLGNLVGQAVDLADALLGIGGEALEPPANGSQLPGDRRHLGPLRGKAGVFVEYPQLLRRAKQG